jgi:hypothetical protein
MDNNMRVRHSKCGSVIKMKQPYNATRFTEYFKELCKIIHKGAGMRTIHSMFGSVGSKIGKKAALPPKPAPRVTELPPGHHRPCPGLTESDIEGVERYL